MLKKSRLNKEFSFSKEGKVKREKKPDGEEKKNLKKLLEK